MWRTLSYSFLVLLSASFLAFSIPLFFSQNAHAASAFDSVVEYSDEIVFMGSTIKTPDDLSDFLRTKTTCSSASIASLIYNLKYQAPGSSNNIIVYKAGAFLRYVNASSGTGLNWLTDPSLPRIIISNTGFSGAQTVIQDNGSCTVVAQGMNYGTPIIQQGDTILFTKGRVFSSLANYPTGYDGEPFVEYEYTPPAPQPSGDAITKAEMEEITHESLEYQRKLAVTIFGLAVSVLLAYAISMKLSRIGR